MTWFDISIIIFLVAGAAVGARLGSLWMGVCLFGGFFGTFLADTYVYSVSEYLGNFSGSFFLAWGLLFAAGLAVILAPGFLLSKVGSVFLAGMIDGAIGLLVGIFGGIVVAALGIFFLSPFYPKLEKQPFWKNSSIVRPAYRSLENLFAKNLSRKKRHYSLKGIAGDVSHSINELGRSMK